MKTLQTVIAVLVVQLGLLLAASYGGALHGLGDSIAVFRPHLGALVALGGLVLLFGSTRRFGAIALLAGVLALGPIVQGFFLTPASAAGGYVLYQKNLLRKSLNRNDLNADIFDAAPDILTLQEIAKHDLRYMRKVFEAYENKVFCGFEGGSQNAVLTTLEMVPGSETCLEDDGLAAGQFVLKDGTKLWVVSVHMGWPFPAAQAEQSVYVADWLATLDGPIMVAGDFNMVPWGYSVARLRKAANSERLGKFLVTYPRAMPFIPLPIDHVLVPKTASGTVELRPVLGSDHYGVVARIDF